MGATTRAPTGSTRCSKAGREGLDRPNMGCSRRADGESVANDNSAESIADLESRVGLAAAEPCVRLE